MRYSTLFGLPAVLAAITIFEESPAPTDWKLISNAAKVRGNINLRFFLKTPDDALEKTLLRVSDPSSEQYGQHLSKEDLDALIRPQQSSFEAVEAFLKQHGLGTEDIEHADTIIKVRVPISKAEELLSTRYASYKNTLTGKVMTRTTQYSLPEALHAHIAMVQPTTMFGLHAQSGIPLSVEPFTASELSSKTTPSTAPGTIGPTDLDIAACNTSISLHCLTALYGFGNYTPTGRGSIGISGFLEQWAQHADLTDFLSVYRPAQAATGNFTSVSIAGGLNLQNAPADNIIEANLDMQYSSGISLPIPQTYYTVGGRPPFIPDLDVTENDSEPYLEYLEWLLAQATLPNVITTSYGENEQSVPLSYRLTVCNLFARLGARGVSVLFSSGDSGPGTSCRTNAHPPRARFLPVFPASCPWVTSVGGTAHVAPERAVGFSSGGFSDTWRAPGYQAGAVARYLAENRETAMRWRRFFNRRGRGFPDVAFQGRRFQTVVRGEVWQVSGTSASAPGFAGVVALLNDNRMKCGRRPLGFLNPLLYAHPEVFNDVVEGRSEGCTGKTYGGVPIEGAAVIEGAGWEAVRGWDPVTGLGTPRFWDLAEL